MSTLQTILSSVEFWKIVFPLLVAIWTWYKNEHQKRVSEQYQLKEINYKELIISLRGFYVGANDADKLQIDFLNQLNVAWLYCPDDIIKKGYTFLNTVHDQNLSTPDNQKELAMGEFVAAIRQDLLSSKLVKDTKLTAHDFKHLGVNKL